MKKILLRLTAATLLLWTAFSGAAHAVTQTINLTQVDFQRLTFNQYSGSGTVSNVRLEWNITATIDSWVDNCGAYGNCDEFSLDLGFTSSGFDGASDFDSQSFNEIYPEINESQYVYFFTNITGSKALDAAGFAALTYGPYLDVYTQYTGGFLVDPGAKLSGFATLSYDVAAVPLPAALPLFAVCLAGLGFVGRRRKIAAA